MGEKWIRIMQRKGSQELLKKQLHIEQLEEVTSAEVLSKI